GIVGGDRRDRLLAAGQWRRKGGAVDRRDRLQRLVAGGPDIPGVSQGALQRGDAGEEGLAQGHHLGRVGALVRRAARQHEGLAVGAGDRLGRRDAGGQAGILVAFEGQRDDDYRIGRGRQRRAGTGSGQRRRRRRAELQRGI